MILKQLKSYLANLPGWRTKRKIVVIESDDWGSIRMPSREVYEKCLKAGYPVDTIAYERYDSLLSQGDLELLFEVLTNFKDVHGNHPVLTANCVVANPDFEKIKDDEYRRYHYELITDTFKRYPKHENNFQLWHDGLANKIFFPQFHAREHLNVSHFMRALQAGDPVAHWGFDNKMPGSMPRDGSTYGNAFVEAMAYDSEEDKHDKLAIFLDGISKFEGLFGYRSESIIPPNYIWSPDFDESVSQMGVRYFQGNRTMIEPLPDGSKQHHRHHLGQRNKWNQLYLVRNVLFEPSMHRLNISDPVSHCLRDMAVAFRMHKPAIISSHRINYVGFIDERNRDTNLRHLKHILKRALDRWPDIEFMTSCELGATIEKSHT